MNKQLTGATDNASPTATSHSAANDVASGKADHGHAGIDRYLQVGFASSAVADKQNEDCFGLVTPAESGEAALRGSVFAVADGGSSDGTGRIASELVVRTLLQDFYATSADWSVERSIDTVLCSVNDWLYVQNNRSPDSDGVVSTLSALLLNGPRYHVAHVGDTRVYRWRAGRLDQLTADHAWPRRDMRHVLRRAVGLDTHLVIDFISGEIASGDVFLIASDGVWEVLGDAALANSISRDDTTELIARELVGKSVENQRRYMGRNDATAMVLRVVRT